MRRYWIIIKTFQILSFRAVQRHSMEALVAAWKRKDEAEEKRKSNEKVFIEFCNIIFLFGSLIPSRSFQTFSWEKK